MSAVLLAAVMAQSWSSMTEAQRAHAMVELQKQPQIRERVVLATDGFVGTPYRVSPLGEGEGRDADPLVRFDAVDCLTLVEQAMALAWAEPEQLVPKLNFIRYLGPPAWENRLHVMESQWLPTQVSRGLLKDVTAVYGGQHTRRVRKVLTHDTWKTAGGIGLGLPEPKQLTGRFEFDVIPPDSALRSLRDAPSGLILVVFRADRPTSVTRVSHVGVLRQSPQGPVLRHASRSFRKVVDEKLAEYLARNLKFAPWTIEGLALFEPQHP
jgi:hypothetical protein